MGNSGSHSQVAQPLPIEEEQKWAHSFPRTPSKKYQHKVLPDRDAPLRLRPTNNGEILHSGGTLSGRHQQYRLSFEEKGYGVYRSNSISSNRPNERHQIDRGQNAPSRSYVSNHKDLLHKSGQRYCNEQRNGFANRREQMKRFGSEPDLRDASSRTLDIPERARARKKYKAPPPPPMAEKSTTDSWEADSEPTRRARLFKTRAETKKKSSPVNNRRNIEETTKKANETANRLSLPEMKRSSSIPEFQAELKEATTRLRNSKIHEDKEKIVENKEEAMKSKLKTLDHNINRKEILRNKLKEMENEPEKIKKEIPKTFYFGMDSDKNLSIPRAFSTNNLVEHFVSTLNPHANVQLNSSGSDLSSELDLGESNVSSSGIALQLRPILPKKQFEIPRFSPATAWKLLSAVESNNAPSTANSDEVPMFIEDRIEKLSRLPPPPTVQDGPRSSHDKSGDSGISGDAGPAVFDENDALTPPQTLPNNLRATGISWTPQQDLGDDSSIEEGLQNNPVFNSNTPLFSPRAHVFSLSLPRENHLSGYVTDKNNMTVYTGLQKLKRSVSGVLNNLGPVAPPKKDTFLANHTSLEQNENWFLSKSAPNSLNNGFNSLELKKMKMEEEDVVGHGQNTGRLMYLPKLDENKMRKSSGESDGFNKQDGDGFSNKKQTDRFESNKKNENESFDNFTAFKFENAHKQENESLDQLNKNRFKNLQTSRHSEENKQNNDGKFRYSEPSERFNKYQNNKQNERSYKNEEVNFQEQGRFEKQQGNKRNETNKFESALAQINKRMENKFENKFNQNAKLSNVKMRDRSRSVDRTTAIQKMQSLSKSCENISGDLNKSSSEPEDLQDPPKFEEKFRIKKPKRFTFQSTVRQIERKRLAEKLSKEAEKKEKQRLRELEAMQRVEEEFQRKRAREKANIRQQLRLYSMEETAWSSLPSNIKDVEFVRQEPEGAVSSSTPSPVFAKEENVKPKRKSIAELHLYQHSSGSESSDENKVVKATSMKVLSEYRQPQREYKDFRGRYHHHQDFSEPKQTIHPEVTCHMPMAHANYNSSSHLGKSANYRKDFAHGKKNSKSGGSTYSDDSQSNANPLMYHSKRAPITRF